MHFTSRVTPDAALTYRHEPRDVDVQELNVVFESSLPPILSDSSDSSSAEMLDAPLMELNVQLVMVVDIAL